MLGLLSKLLNENARAGATQNDMTALVVSLAVQGLQALCQEEVLSVCLSICLSVVCLFVCINVGTYGKKANINQLFEQSSSQRIKKFKK